MGVDDIYLLCLRSGAVLGPSAALSAWCALLLPLVCGVPPAAPLAADKPPNGKRGAAAAAPALGVKSSADAVEYAQVSKSAHCAMVICVDR